MINKIKKHFMSFVVALLCLISCEAPMSPFPSFKPIKVDENTIFLTSRWDDYCHKIIAFDTKTETKIYTYEFPESIIYDFFYNKAFDESVYFLTLNGRVAALNPLTGKVKELHFELIREANCFTYIDNELWITPCVPGLRDTPITYAVYNAHTEKIRYETLPGGEMYWSNFAGYRDNGIYVPLLYSLGYSDIYNLTQNQFVDLSCFEKENKEYLYFDFFDPYLLCTFERQEKDKIKRDVDVFRYSITNNILSVEKLFSATGFFTTNLLCQNENFIALSTNNSFIAFDKKDNYKERIRIPIETKDWHCTLHKDNIYIVQAWTDKIYKFNMTDLTCSLI